VVVGMHLTCEQDCNSFIILNADFLRAAARITMLLAMTQHHNASEVYALIRVTERVAKRGHASEALFEKILSADLSAVAIASSCISSIALNQVSARCRRQCAGDFCRRTGKPVGDCLGRRGPWVLAGRCSS
jgi:hypothetical protein